MLNTMAGKLTVEGSCDLEAIRKLGREEDYKITPITEASPETETLLQVDGISCLDCAGKFEKAVNEASGGGVGKPQYYDRQADGFRAASILRLFAG